MSAAASFQWGSQIPGVRYTSKTLNISATGTYYTPNQRKIYSRSRDPGRQFIIGHNKRSKLGLHRYKGRFGCFLWGYKWYKCQYNRTIPQFFGMIDALIHNTQNAMFSGSPKSWPHGRYCASNFYGTCIDHISTTTTFLHSRFLSLQN